MCILVLVNIILAFESLFSSDSSSQPPSIINTNISMQNLVALPIAHRAGEVRFQYHHTEKNTVKMKVTFFNHFHMGTYII